MTFEDKSGVSMSQNQLETIPSFGINLVQQSSFSREVTKKH